MLSPEFWNGELLGYRIYYSENSRSFNPKTKTIRNVDTSKATISNLKSYVTYEISMKAFNQIGEGPPSPSLSITTLESGEVHKLKIETEITESFVINKIIFIYYLVPTSAPQNVECSALSPESIRIRWRPPHQEWNGVLQGYKLSYQVSNPKPSKTYF